MATQIQTAEEAAAIIERGMALAQQIKKESWLAAGMTEEEWERSHRAEEVYIKLVTSGVAPEKADDYIDKVSWEEIERRHREMYPQKYADSSK